MTLTPGSRIVWANGVDGCTQFEMSQWNGQPLGTCFRFNLYPVKEASFGEGHIVIVYEDIRKPNLFE